MKNESEFKTNTLYILIAFLLIWGMAGAFLFIKYTPHTSILGIALNVFIVIFSLTQLFPYSSWVSLIISTLLFIGSSYSLLIDTQEVLISSGIGTAIFLITTFLCKLYTKQIQQLKEKHTRLQQVIDSLLIYDQNTSLMRWKFAKQALSTEILRGRRYQNDVCLVLFDIRNKEQFPQEDIRRIRRSIAEIIQNSIRTDIDIAFTNDVMGLILPETGSSGAQVLTGRLIKRFARKVDANIVAGIASFPQDAVTEEEIIERTEDALRIALHSDRTIINFHSLHQEQTEEEQELEGDESTQPIYLDKEQSTQQDYITILENINLDINEWVVWIEGFNQMSDLIQVQNSLLASDFVEDLEFLFLQANHLVVRIQSSSERLEKESQPFPGWQIKKMNTTNHYILIAEEESDHNSNVT